MIGSASPRRTPPWARRSPPAQLVRQVEAAKKPVCAPRLASRSQLPLRRPLGSVLLGFHERPQSETMSKEKGCSWWADPALEEAKGLVHTPDAELEEVMLQATRHESQIADFSLSLDESEAIYEQGGEDGVLSNKEARQVEMAMLATAR